jgi:hypothetical protein
VRVLKRDDEKDRWLKRLLERRHVNIATVALAHKTVRTVWAMLAHDREYCPNYKSLSCAWSPVYGWHYACVQIDTEQCGKLPACGTYESQQIKPCCRTQWSYVGYPLASSGVVSGITWMCPAAANSSVPSGLGIDGHNIVGTPAPGSAGSHLVVIEAIDGGLPPAHTSVSWYRSTMKTPRAGGP